MLELAQTTLDHDEKRVAREKLGRLKVMESVLRSQTKQRRSTRSDAPEETNMVTPPRRFDNENAAPDNRTREHKRSGPFGIGKLFGRR